MTNQERAMIVNLRIILRTGASVFGLSAILLIAAPGLFLELLGLDGTSEPLMWAMRMIGITLVALAGNMWMNSLQGDDEKVRQVGVVMAVSATALGILTLMIPVPLTWFAIVYSIVGFSFGAAYVIALISSRR